MIEKTFTDTVEGLCHDGLDDDARVFIIDGIHELAEADLWSVIDSILLEVNVDSLRDHPLVLLSFLSATTCLKHNLKRRDSFKRAVEDCLQGSLPGLTGTKMLN